jgi:hypothetical protein
MPATSQGAAANNHLVSTADPEAPLCDSTVAWRDNAMSGVLHSGDVRLRQILVRTAVVALLWTLTSCGVVPDPVASDCVLPSDPVTIIDEDGLVLKVWTFPLQEVHTRPVLPDEPGLLAYRATIRSEGAEERHPVLHVPPVINEAEADIWRDENFNNDLAYRGGVGSIDPITCLDALLFAEQNARVPQLEHPTEFLASVLLRQTTEGDEAVVLFGAGMEMFPPSSVLGSEIIDEYVAQGWRYWYWLHNHTRQADGALGLPVPSTSDVRFARSLAVGSGLERVRVTNGFYTFDAAIDEMVGFRFR